MAGKSIDDILRQQAAQRLAQRQEQQAQERALNEQRERQRQEHIQRTRMFETLTNVNQSVAAAAASAGGSLKITPVSDGRYYIRLLDANNNNTIMFNGFFYIDENTNIVQSFYDSTNPTVDIRSTGGNGGPTYLYYPGWLCFDGGGCNITSFPYLYGASTGDYNMYGNANNSSTGNNIDGYGNVTFLFSLTPFD